MCDRCPLQGIAISDKGHLLVLFIILTEWVKTKIFEMRRLEVGNFIEGPAIREGEDTTIVLPKDRTVTVDEFGNMVIENR